MSLVDHFNVVQVYKIMTYLNILFSRRPIYLAVTCCFYFFIGIILPVEAQNTPPVFVDCSIVTLNNTSPGCGPVFAQIDVAAESNCMQGSVLIYSWQLDLNNDGSINGQGSGKLMQGLLPLGNHRVVFRVEDECSLVSICERLVEVVDKKPPVPFCKEIVLIHLLPATGINMLSANAFVSPPTQDNCTSYDELQFRIEFASDLDPLQTEPDGDADIQLRVTCDDLYPFGPEFKETILWVGDEANNWDYCKTKVEVVDQMGVCPLCSPHFFTIVRNENNVPIPDVTMTLIGPQTFVGVTGSKGQAYLFPFLNLSNDTATFTALPSKTTNPLNGVSTLDLILLSKLLKGELDWSSPFQRIAADINADCSVTISDFIELRKMLIKPGTNFKHNSSWRFVDGYHTFPDPNKPCDFPESLSQIVTFYMGWYAHFTGIKIGDLNLDHDPASLTDYPPTDFRNSEEGMILKVTDAHFQSGELVPAEIHLAGLQAMDGYQFTISFDPSVLVFEGIQSGSAALDDEHFGVSMVDKGIILVSWVGNDPGKNPDLDASFQILFRTRVSGSLKESLTISDQYLRPEVYNVAGEILNIRLSFEDVEPGIPAMKDLVIIPNPARDEARIRFTLEAAAEVQLILTNALGIHVFQSRMAFPVGQSAWAIPVEHLPAGAYRCTIQYEEETHHRMIILVD